MKQRIKYFSCLVVSIVAFDSVGSPAVTKKQQQKKTATKIILSTRDSFNASKTKPNKGLKLEDKNFQQPANVVASTRVESEVENELINLQKNAANKSSHDYILSQAIDALADDHLTSFNKKQYIEENKQDVDTSIDINQSVPEERDYFQTTILQTQPLLGNDTFDQTSIVAKNGIQTSSTNKKLYLGRAYNYAIIDEEQPRRFCVFFSPYFSYCSNSGFDDCKRSVPLSTVVTGTNLITIGDIFLESRLAALGLLTTAASGPTPQGPAPQFSSPPQQQYLALLAPMQVNFTGSERTYGTNTSLIYRFPLNSCETVFGAVGLTVPILCIQRNLGFTFQNGVLEDERNFAAQGQTQREFTTRSFFTDFESVEDFFIRAVLQPKGLIINPSADKFGFGDVSIFALADFGGTVEHLDGLQFGFNLQLPTSNKVTGNQLWEIQLGNGGGMQLDLYGNVIVHSGNVYLNPTLYVAGIFTFSYSTNRRVPSIVTNTPVSNSQLTSVLSVPGLIAPVYTFLYAKPFSQPDSLIPAFADNNAIVKINTGSRAVVGVGDYVYFMQDCELRLGVFYDFSAKGANEYCPINNGSTIFASQYRCGLSEFAHRLSWHGAYKFGCGEFMVGSEHIVAGRNVLKSNNFFVTAVVTF